MTVTNPGCRDDAPESRRLRVQEVSPADYDAFVRQSTPYPLWHLSQWERPLAVYGLKLRRVVVVDANGIRGVLAVVFQQSMLFGRRAVSLPWVDASGLLSTDTDAETRLIEAAVDLIRTNRLSSLILRSSRPVADWQVERDDKLAMELTLNTDPDRVWKGFDPKVRNQVRKGEKSGLTVVTVAGNDVAEFYDVYSQNMRDLGSPPHSREFFQSVKDSFADEAQIHLARFEGRVVGGGMTIRNGGRLDIPWASSLHEYNRLCVNHALYWHMIRGACVAGCQSFYFGRSTRGSGPHHFKKQWGATEVPLYWYRLDVHGSPQVDNRPPQESFGLAIRLWKKLPVGIARRLGPWLISQLD